MKIKGAHNLKSKLKLQLHYEVTFLSWGSLIDIHVYPTNIILTLNVNTTILFPLYKSDHH